MRNGNFSDLPSHDEQTLLKSMGSISTSMPLGAVLHSFPVDEPTGMSFIIPLTGNTSLSCCNYVLCVSNVQRGCLRCDVV